MEFKTLFLFCCKTSGYIVELIVPLNLGLAGNPSILKDLADTEEAQTP